MNETLLNHFILVIRDNIIYLITFDFVIINTNVKLVNKYVLGQPNLTRSSLTNNYIFFILTMTRYGVI